MIRKTPAVVLCAIVSFLVLRGEDDPPPVSVGPELRLNEFGWDIPPARTGTLRGQAAPLGEDLLVVYRGAEPGDRSVQVFARRVSAEGEVGPTVSVSGEERGAFIAPTIAVDPEGAVHVVWMHVPRRAENTLFYRRSRDGGGTWDPVRRFAAGVSRVAPILVAGEDGELYIVFSSTMESRNAEVVYFFASTDGGDTWLENDVNFPGEGIFAQSPAVAVGAEGRVALAWANHLSGRVAAVFSLSTDRGQTWLSEPMVVSDDQSIRISEPKVVHRGERYFVFWLDKAGTRHRVWMDSSAVGELAWGEDRLLFEVDADRFEWDVVGDGKWIYVVCLEGLRRGPLQRERAAILPIMVSDGAVGDVRPVSFASELGESRILGLAAAEVNDALLVSSLTYDADRRFRRQLDRFEGGEGPVRLIEEILPAGMDRAHWTLIPHGGQTALLYRESAGRILPQESVWRGNLKLVQYFLDRRR